MRIRRPRVQTAVLQPAPLFIRLLNARAAFTCRLVTCAGGVAHPTDLGWSSRPVRPDGWSRRFSAIILIS